MNGIADQKARLRRSVRAALRALSAAEMEAAGRAVAATLEACRPERSASTVALYAALPDELPTRPIFEGLRRRRARVLLPRVEAGRALTFHVVTAWEDLAAGRYGVLEPPEGSEVIPPREAQVVLLPGVAFDPAGHRLGRGGGYYDAAFPAGERAPLLVGLGFELQVVAAVPHADRDRSVDAIVTEQAVRWVTERR